MNIRQPEVIQGAILGCLINWPGERDTVASMIQPEDFITAKHRTCYEWMISATEYDLITAVHGLEGKVPATDLVDWSTSEVTSAFLPKYCMELKDAANKVRLYDLATDLRTMFKDRSYQEMREFLDSTLSQLTTSKKRNTMLGAKTLVNETLNRVEQRYSSDGTLAGIPYGWPELDEKTDGLHRGDLVIVAGRPSMGKSAFAGNVFENVTRSGYQGVFFSLEMGQEQVMDRMTASVGRVKFQNVRSGRLESDEWHKFTRACESMIESTMRIDDTPSLSLTDLKAKCRKLKSKDGLDLVIVDYLQLMKMPAKDNRVQAIGEISRGLKLLARELDCTVMALSQLNRSVDSRADKRPTMSDLRDSGEIEQDADVILFPYRPAAYCDKCRDRKDSGDHNTASHQSVAEIIIEKQRNGERNISVPMAWIGKYQKFTEVQNG